MSIMTSADLADLQAAALLVMGDTATISRATRTLDNAGGYSDTYAAAGTTPCQIVRPSGVENAILAGEQGEVSIQAVVKVPVTTTLLLRDRLTVGATKYEVVVVLPVITYGAVYRAGLVVIA